jgi:glutamate/tyrosine decarboxylase-like PLP-dependent enzyme
MAEIIPAAKEAGAWVHVDGAFGFWAAVSPSLAHLAAGQELADSWATDAHKYLNVPYDAGIALVRNPSVLERELSVAASYLPEGKIGHDPLLYTPELSRRARGIPTWAALRTLGRRGLIDLIDRTVSLAQRFARGLADAGFEILNEVVLNQVLVRFGDAEATRRVIAAVQRDGTLYAGPTQWQGRTALRLSVSNWSTDESDIDRAVEAIRRCAAEETAGCHGAPTSGKTSPRRG